MREDVSARTRADDLRESAGVVRAPRVASLRWPRILYWTALGVTVVGLVYAMTQITVDPTLTVRPAAQAGGAVLALIGVAGLLSGKAWMDRVVRGRSYLPCPSCETQNPYVAIHCSTCGQLLRITQSWKARTAQETPATQLTLGLVRLVCGQKNPPGSRFCSSCSTRLGSITE